jgi:hypothetical protein
MPLDSLLSAHERRMRRQNFNQVRFPFFFGFALVLFGAAGIGTPAACT